ncbi:MAG: hypothetical protein ACE5EQ_11335 [Phycisphaerae bacterium]
MIHRHHPSRFVGTALLCVGLTLNLQIGCGGMGMPAPDLNSRFSKQVVLTPGSALSATLAGTPFEGATALAVDPVTREFELELPGVGRGLNGGYTLVSGDLTVTRMSLVSGDLQLDISFDTERHVIAMGTSTGLHWVRPAHWNTGLVDPDLTGLDAFLSANAELVEFARAMDSATNGGGESPPSSGGSDPKSDPSAQFSSGDLSAIMNMLSSLLPLQAVIANLPAIVWVFEVVIAVQVTMSLMEALIEQSPASPDPFFPSSGALLTVTNSLSDGSPIWSVRLAMEDGTVGPDMLAGEAIPAGASRDFAVAAGVRDVAVRVPSGKSCFVEYVRKARQFVVGKTEEVVITDEDSGTLTPEGCDNG